MPRGSPSSTPGSRSRTSSQGSEKNHTLSVNIYGRGAQALNDPPAHWGTMIHRQGEIKGDLHHVRKNEDFYYDRSSRPIESTTTFGRSDIQRMSDSRRQEAEGVLDRYGKDPANLPRGTANCQDWTVGALAALEHERLAPAGTSEYWKQNIGMSSPEVGARLVSDGRSWIPKANSQPQRHQPADATYGRGETRKKPGRLNMNKFAGLSGSSSKPSR